MGSKQKSSNGNGTGEAHQEDGANARTVAPRPGRADETAEPTGTLIIIGGHEDREGERVILREVARRLNGGRLVVATVASHEPEGYFETYRRAFADLGVTDMAELYVHDRPETLDGRLARALDGAAGVFFTGGDQLRISSQIGDTPVERRVREIHEAGGVVAGTSAGASVMSETMLVKGSSGESPSWLVIFSWSPPVKNTAVAPSKRRSRSSDFASARLSTSRCAMSSTPSSRKIRSYSSQSSAAALLLATVATTSRPPRTRSATARRISRSPRLSSSPPMMISVAVGSAV